MDGWEAEDAGLALAFSAHAARRPEEPWLFVQEGWDWRWTSFAEAARWLAAIGEVLADLPPGTRVGYAGRLSPSLVAADLAVQAAGLLAVPVDPNFSPSERREAARECRCGAWLELGDEPAEEAPLPLVRRAPSLGPPGGRSAPARAPAALAAVSHRLPGGAVVLGEAGPREIGGEALAAEACALAARIGAERAREITVLARSLADLLARRQLAWATVAGAAVVLEPDPAAFVATAVWVRPTLLAGGAADLEAALARAETCPRGPRSPFGRLHAWLIPEDERVPERATAGWQARGVRILRISGPG